MNTKNETSSPLDKHLDAILMAAGNSLPSFTRDASPGFVENARTALSAAVAELAPARAAPAGELSDEQIDALHKIAVDECAEQLGITADALRTDTTKVASFRRTFARVIEFAAGLALHPGAAPAGWQWAPVDPTAEMEDAFTVNRGFAVKYRAMLAVAPQPSAVQPVAPAGDAAMPAPGAEALKELAADYANEMACESTSTTDAWPDIEAAQKKLYDAIDALAGNLAAVTSERDTLADEMAEIAVATGRSKTDGRDTDWYGMADDVAKLADKLADASKDTRAICEIDKVMLCAGAHWPDSAADPLVVRSVKELTRMLSGALAEVEALRKDAGRLAPVIAAAQEWSSERMPSDHAEGALMKALSTMEGDWPGCEGCDHECDEPCVPATVVQMHASVDACLAKLEAKKAVDARKHWSDIEAAATKAVKP